MANIFQIKYLYDIFPDIDFTQEFVTCQTITEKDPLIEYQSTEDKWGHIIDNVKINRHIQSTKYRQYHVKIELSRNIDISIIKRADYVSLTTTEGETFHIFDVNITYTNVSGSLNYIIEMTFKRDAEINNHLDSANCLAYKTAESAAVNELGFDVNDPSYVINNESIAATNAEISRVAITSLLDNMIQGEYYYFNVSDPDFKDENKTLIYVYEKTSTEFKFRFYPFGSLSKTYTGCEIIITNELQGGVAADVLVTSKTISPVIYSFINPIYGHIDEDIEGQKAPEGIAENQKIIAKDKVNFKVWLTVDEIWKAEYLKYALYDEILFDPASGQSIRPIQVKGIITPKENKNLLDLYEFDIEILYNNKVVSYNR
jgi:hypothetical protein